MWQKRFGRLRNDSDGSIAVILAVGLMVVLVGFISLAVDVGHLYTVRNELQNTADAAGLSAAMALIQQDANGVVFRDAPGAVTAAMNTINTAGAKLGLPSIASSDSALSINFGIWDDKTSTWTLIGDQNAVPSSSTANAVQITIQRANTGTYGPVTNFFAGIFGSSSKTSQVSATSRAYMGYTYGVALGTVKVCLAMPSSGHDSPLVMSDAKSASGWWAWLFGPDKAVADTGAWRTVTFKDTGGNNVPDNVTSGNPASDVVSAYWFVANASDPVPNTITNILTEAALTTHTHHNDRTGSSNNWKVYFVDPLTYGTQIYAKSEYKYCHPWLTDNFGYLKAAYNANKDANNRWRVTLPVYGGTRYPLSAKQRLEKAFRYLAQLLGPAEAYACYSFTAPNIYVNGFVNVDIVDVQANAGCNDCTHYNQIINPDTNQYYTTRLECLQKFPSGCWQSNYATIKNVTDLSTVIPNEVVNPGNPNVSTFYNPNAAGTPGGPSYQQLNSGAQPNVGAYANVPRLIPVN